MGGKLQVIPIILAGIPSEISRLGEAAVALPATGGITGGPEEGFDRAI